MRIVIVAVFSLLAICPMKAHAASDDLNDELAEHRKHRMIKSSRHVDISPSVPADGIQSGLVMAYGHIIPPPYKVEFSGRKLIINGVQVQPSLMQEQWRSNHPIKTPSADENSRAKSANDLFDEAKKLYSDEKGKTPDDKLKAKILQHLQSRSDVMDQVEWHGWSDICFRIHGELGLTCRGLPSPQLPPDFHLPNAVPSAQARREAILTVETQLRRGQWVVYGEGGLNAFRPDEHQKVRAIMEDSSLSKPQRFQRLREVLGDEGFALDVIDNYTPEEWTLKRDKK